MKIDTTKYAAMVANAAARVKISSTAFKNFIADVKAVIDGNDDAFTAHKSDYANHGNLKNKIINGNFAINQRVKSGTVVLTAGQYGHDRWKAGASGCTYSFVTVENVTTITITAGSLQQVIEGTSLFTGTHTLSWTGTAQGKIGAGSYGATGITGNATGGTNLTIEFNTGTLSKVQLEEGDYATPIEQRHFGLELALCQRYCRVITDALNSNFPIGYGFAVTSTISLIGVSLPTEMRTQPTLVATASDFSLLDGIATISLTAISIQPNQNGKTALTLRAEVASGLTAFRPYTLAAVAATKRLILDAEL